MVAAVALWAFVTLFLVLPAAARLRSSSLYRGDFPAFGIAVDGSGRVHLSWISLGLDNALHHAWIENGKKHDEIVDASSGCCGEPSIAVDSMGHPHIAYQAWRITGRSLLYAHFDGTAWQLEEVGPGGSGTAIAIDANDRPHIVQVLYDAHASDQFQYLHRDDDGIWQRETPPGIHALGLGTSSFALDSQGNAHVVLMDPPTRHPFYATNAGGEWSATELASSAAAGESLALDSLGRPHVALALSEAGTVRYAHFDGMQWVSEDLYDPNQVAPPSIQIFPEGVALALDPADRPQLIFVLNLAASRGNLDVSLHAFHDGFEWRAILLQRSKANSNVGLVSGADGVMHGLISVNSRRAPLAKYVRITLHDLAGEWTSLGSTEKAGKSTVTAVLHVRNEGNDTSPPTAIALYLSDDATLDAGDTPVRLKKTVGSIRPGATKDVKLSFKTAVALSGKFLIAVLDPLHKRAEADRSDDTIAGALPQ